MIEWHFLRFRFLARPHFQIATVGTVQDRRNRGAEGVSLAPLPHILVDQLTLYQLQQVQIMPTKLLFAPSSRFLDLPTALQNVDPEGLFFRQFFVPKL